ncbi:MAG: 16S rRNA (guanine(966)-N(2))-methyltransferase RsmD, partial [Sphingobacteriaceae bacterium]
MRIIGGRLKGLRINPPNNLPVRPTTDLAKEALFNILNNLLDFEGLKVLDLFSGTGNIAMEFASRGAEKVIAVDRAAQCIFYLKDMSAKHKLPEIST